MSRPRPEPTAEQLQLAYRQLRTAHWPDTVEASLQHAIYGPLMRTHALRMGRPSWTPAPRPKSLPQNPPPLPPTPEVTSPGATKRPSTLPRLRHDPRRLAANDVE